MPDALPSKENSYADRLRFAMKRAGVSASRLADLMGRSRAAIYAVLGGRSNFTAYNNAAAANVLSCSPDWLAGFSDKFDGRPVGRDRVVRIALDTANVQQFRSGDGYAVSIPAGLEFPKEARLVAVKVGDRLIIETQNETLEAVGNWLSSLPALQEAGA